MLESFDSAAAASAVTRTAILMTDTLTLTIEAIPNLELSRPPESEYFLSAPETDNVSLGSLTGGSKEQPIEISLVVNGTPVEDACTFCPITLSETNYLLMQTSDEVFARNFFMLTQEAKSDSLVQ